MLIFNHLETTMIEVIFTSEAARKSYGELTYATPGSAAIDLRAMIDSPMVILPSEQAMIPTGIKLNMQTEGIPYPFGLAAIALPRSGRGSKDGLVLGNTAGLIDTDYQGEIRLCVWARPTSGHLSSNNRMGGTPIHIEPGERIAQLMFVPVFKAMFKTVDEFTSASHRGAGGFGSTGNE